MTYGIRVGEVIINIDDCNVMSLIIAETEEATNCKVVTIRSFNDELFTADIDDWFRKKCNKITAITQKDISVLRNLPDNCPTLQWLKETVFWAYNNCERPAIGVVF